MDASAVLAKFEESVRLFAAGNHVGASEALAAAQHSLPSAQLVPLLMQNVILAGGGSSNLLALALQLTSQFSSLGEAFAFTVQKHFYAFRLIAHGVTGDYSTVWRPQFEGMVQSVEQYLALNTELLTGAATGDCAAQCQQHHVTPAQLARMARPLASEISSLWAVLWKLELCAVSNTEDATEASLEAPFAALAGRLSSMLYQCPSITLEPILTNLVTAACEEFGLLHKASRQRGVSWGVHEVVRRHFTAKVLPTIAVAAFATLAKCVGRGGASTENMTALAAVARLLAVVLSWRFRTFDPNASFLLLGMALQQDAPEVLDISNEQWRQVLEAPASPNGSGSPSSPLMIFATLIDAVALITHTKASSATVSVELLGTTMADLLHALVQAASVDAAFWDAGAKGHYASCAWAAAMRLCDRAVSGGKPEVVTAACLALRRVLSSMNVLPILFAAPTASSSFVAPLAQVTTSVIGQLGEAEAAAANKFLASSANVNSNALVSFDGDDGANGAVDVFLEGLDHLLNGWLGLVRGCVEDVSVRVTLPDENVAAIGAGAAEVLKTFVNAKVALHSGQTLLADDGAEAPESSHAVEYANSNTQLIAIIARENAADVCTYLHQQLSSLASYYMDNYASKGLECPMALNEALWYVITVVAEYIAPKFESERPCIPTPFINLGIRCEKQWPGDVSAQIANNSFFGLCGYVFQLSEALMPHVLKGTVSPGIAQALLDVLGRYTSTYLLADPMNQSEQLESFASAFGNGTQAAAVVLSFLAASLKSFAAYPHVADSAAVVLQCLLRLPSEFSQWAVSGGAGANLPPMLSQAAGGVTAWFAFYSSCALGGLIVMPSNLRAKCIGFLLSVAGHASIDTLNAATSSGGGGGGFGCFGGAEERPLTPEAAAATTIGQLTAHMAAVLNSEVRRSPSSTIAVLEVIGGLVEGLGQPLVVKACAMSGLTALVIAAVEAAVASHSADPSSDRMALTAAATMVERVLVGIGCFFDTATYVRIVRVALQLTQYVGTTLRAEKEKAARKAAAAGGAASAAGAMLADGNDLVELLTSTSKMVAGIASWGAMDFSLSAANAEDASRNQLVSQVSVEGLSIALDFLDETTALIPGLRDEVFRLMKEVTATYTAAMLALMSPAASNALLQALNFAFGSGVPDLVESGCSVVQSFAAYSSEQQQGGGGGGEGAALAGLLGSFLQRLAHIILVVPIDTSITSSVGGALLELTRALGPSAVVQTFHAEAAASCPQLMGPINGFFEGLQTVDLSSRRHNSKAKFLGEVEKLITVAQGTRQLIA